MTDHCPVLVLPKAGAAIFFSHVRGTGVDSESVRAELKCIVDVSAEFLLVATGSRRRECKGQIPCYF